MSASPPGQAVVVRPGDVVAGKYRVERELGRGGFGVVVRAVHLTLDQRVAIKILTEGEGGTPADLAIDAERFRREAQATATLKSDHVVRILDVDVLESGWPYIVMEYLEGVTLHERVYGGAPMDVGEAVDVAVQMLAALGEAHAAGIVHRDLKPANVFMVNKDAGAFVKVLDFGVSKIGNGATMALTRTGALLGTVAYMAPEQMVDAKRVDARGDLWATGVILYEALTKQMPFGPATSPAIVTTVLTRTPKAPSAHRPGLPSELEAVVLRCLEKDPERRYSSAAELAAALAPFASNRARAALEALRRCGPPQGAAAPMTASARASVRAALDKTPGPPRRGVRFVLFVSSVMVVVGLLLGVVVGIFVVWLPSVSSAPVSRPVRPEPEPSVATPKERAVSPSAVAPSSPLPPPVVAASSAPPAPVVPPPASPKRGPCDPPSYYDANGIKKYKPGCLR